MAPVTWQEFLAAQEKEEYPAAPEQYSALRVLFADPEVPVSQVAKQIAGPVVQAVQNSLKNPEATDEYRYGILWRTITDAINQLTVYNDKLVELVVEIQKVPDPAGHIASMIDFQHHWTEFAFDFQDPISTDPDLASKRQGWLNMNAFCAKLSTYGIPQLDERDRSAWIMRQTLEKTPWEVFHHPDIDEREQEADEDDDVVREWCDHQLELRDVRTLNIWAPAAALWIKIIGKGLYEMQGPMDGEWEWNTTNWKGPKGWSKERFSYWRERFEWISKVTALDKSTKKEAANAAEIMKRIENGAWDQGG